MSEAPAAAVPFRAPVADAPPADVSARPANTNDSKAENKLTHRAGSPIGDGPTPYVYAALERKPYSVKYLGIDLYHADKDFPDVRELAEQLDEYVIKQAKARGLADKHESYKEVVDAMYKQIGKSANEEPLKALKRLATAATALDRLESAKLPPVLSAKTLTPVEFEEVLA